MFHPGKILAIHSSKDKNIRGDNSTQATLQMWDENMITFAVIPEIIDKIKKGDIVLVDYSPISEKVPLPKHTIIKVLKENKGKEIWNEYQKYFKKRGGNAANAQKIKAIKPAKPEHTYAG